MKDESKVEADIEEKKVGDNPEQDGEPKKPNKEIFTPQVEYSTVCNADFLPMICNDFIQDFLEREHGACQINRNEAINLTRNFCDWIANNGLTCARISLF